MSELQGHHAPCLTEHPLESQHGETVLGSGVAAVRRHSTFSPSVGSLPTLALCEQFCSWHMGLQLHTLGRKTACASPLHIAPGVSVVILRACAGVLCG